MSDLVRFRRANRRRSLSHPQAQTHYHSDLRNAETNAQSRASKKRRRLSSPERIELSIEGSTCPICLDLWEKSGQHRLSALRCGHLFGESCIRRWFSSLAEDKRCCPTCQTKSRMSDIRFIYARHISAVDKSELQRLQRRLDDEKWKVFVLNAEVAQLRQELDGLRNDADELNAK